MAIDSNSSSGTVKDQAIKKVADRITAPEITAGTETDPKSMSPKDVVEIVTTHETAGGATNLSVANKTATTLDVASDTGTDATIPAAVPTTAAGLLTGADKAKLDGIEAGATADQTDAEIKTAYENNANTNAFTDAEKTNLGNQSGTNTGDEVSASETVEGIVERATDAEAAAGTDTTRYITPKQLADNSGGSTIDESTGVKTGGVLSTGAGSNQYSISDGTGQTVLADGTKTEITWSGLSNIIPTNIGTQLITFVGIQDGGGGVGAVIEQSTNFTPTQRKTIIALGVAVHVNLVDVDVVNNLQQTAYNTGSGMYSLMESLGFFNISGNIFSANGANLNIDKSVGLMFKAGSNYDTDVNDEHRRPLAALTGLTFQYRFSDGSNGVTGIAIDPDNLDDGAGGLTAVGNNQWSIQRIYSFTSNNVKIQRGVSDYASLDDARAGRTAEAYVTEPSVKANGLLRGWLYVKKGATDLSGIDALFEEAPKFGEGGGSAGAGGGGVKPELTKSIYLPDPVATDDIGIWEPGISIRITKVVHRIIGGTSFDFNLNHSGGTDLWTVDKQNTGTRVAETTFDNDNCTADNYIRLQGSASVGAPNALEITITYVEN